jgi:hypothetical protein
MAFGIAQRLVRLERSPEFRDRRTGAVVRVHSGAPSSKRAPDCVAVCILCNAEHDEMIFTVNSNYPLAVQNVRTYRHFSDAAQDVVDVGIY